MARWQDEPDPNTHMADIQRSIQESQLGNRFRSTQPGRRFLAYDEDGEPFWTTTQQSAQFLRRPSEMNVSDISNIKDPMERQAVRTAIEVLFFEAKSPEEKAYLHQLLGDVASLHFESAFTGTPGETKGATYGNRTDQAQSNRAPVIATDAFSDQVEVPTSTSDYARPRTVAAAYDPSRSTITIVFRDGTFYNYYEVDQDTWKRFRSISSKGNFIKKTLDSHPRGPADMSTINEYTREILYKAYYSAQVRYTGHIMPRKGSHTSKASPVLQPHVKKFKKRKKFGHY